jgi:crotonobetainyl-CoA:carnitine CoA-transferase CaiB-like acyl-CoA transferase
MSGSTDTMARRVFDAIGQGALFDDPRYSTNAARLARDAEIDRMVADFVATLDLDACLAIFREKGVTAGPVNDVAQLLADEHVVARGSYVVAEDGTGGPGVVMHGVTPVLERTPGRLRLRAPRRGEHSAQVLAELGYDRDAIDALVRAGAVECG